MCLLVLIIACVIDHFLFALKIHLYAVKLWQNRRVCFWEICQIHQLQYGLIFFFFFFFSSLLNSCHLFRGRGR